MFRHKPYVVQLMISQSFYKYFYVFLTASLLIQTGASASDENPEIRRKISLHFSPRAGRALNDALETNSTYYPPTYSQDGFTHATANPDFLLTIGNHFYTDVEGGWLCLRMSVDSLAGTGVRTIFEGTAPVGDKEADFEGTDSELFPHILGGIHPSAVLQAHNVFRSENGRFLSVENITDGGNAAP